MKDANGVFHYDVLIFKIAYIIFVICYLIAHIHDGVKSNLLVILMFAGYFVWIKSDICLIVERLRLKKKKKERKNEKI